MEAHCRPEPLQRQPQRRDASSSSSSSSSSAAANSTGRGSLVAASHPSQAPRAPIVLDEDAVPEGGHLDTDTVVRLVGLKGAAQFNGCHAFVLQWLADRGRYEVCIQPSGEKKAVQPVNFENLSMEEEATRLRDWLASPAVPVVVVRSSLRRLEQLRVTTEVLFQTKVGKVVNEISKTFSNLDDVADISKRLVFRWRDMWRLQAAAEKAKSPAGAPTSPASVASAASVAPPDVAPTTMSAASVAKRRDPKRARIAEVAPSPPADGAAVVRVSVTSALDAPAGPAPTAALGVADATVSVSAAVPQDLSMEVEEAGSPQPVAVAEEIDADAQDQEQDSAHAATAARLMETYRAQLASLHPVYVDMLLKNPVTLDFLAKHPSVMGNLNADNVKFLIRNIMRSSQDSKQQEDVTQRQAGSATGRSITISNLPAEATESDVVSLLSKAGLGSVEVSLARDSRYRRSCGVAWATLASRQAAMEAVKELHNIKVHGQRVRVESAVGASSHKGGGRRIAWKQDDELWDVAIFDRFESVLNFRERVNSHTAMAPAAVVAPESAERFREATARERAEEARRVREALSQQPN